jgi:hypothetical protein
MRFARFLLVPLLGVSLSGCVGSRNGVARGGSEAARIGVEAVMGLVIGLIGAATEPGASESDSAYGREFERKAEEERADAEAQWPAAVRRAESSPGYPPGI